jgi:hypothetical protein
VVVDAEHTVEQLEAVALRTQTGAND